MSTALGIVQSHYPQVKRVVDARAPLEIEVSERDLLKAIPKDHNHCALAEACRRNFKPDGVLVSLEVAYIIHGTTATRYHVPQTIRQDVIRFDRTGGFKPGEYWFNPPNPTDQLGKREKSRGLGGAHGPRTGGMRKKFHRHPEGVRANLLVQARENQRIIE